MGVLWSKIGEGVVRYWPPTNSFFLLGVLTSVPILVNIDQEMRPWECSQADWHTDTLTDANRFYNLSHVISYSYGTDNNNNTHSKKLVDASLQSRRTQERQCSCFSAYLLLFKGGMRSPSWLHSTQCDTRRMVVGFCLVWFSRLRLCAGGPWT